MSAAAAVVSRASGRGGIGAAIVGVHVLLIYAICNWTPIRAVFEQPPLEASIIDTAPPEQESTPPPPPQIVRVELPVMEPPLVTITEEPPPNAITIAKVDQPTPPPRDQGAPRVVTDVAYLQAPAPKYPAESKRSGEEGLVVLRVLINELGRAAQIDVERSSGFARLDAAARTAVESALFKPYIENGAPRMALAMIPIEFTWKSRAAGRGRRS